MVRIDDDGFFALTPHEEVIEKLSGRYVVFSMHEDDEGYDVVEFVEDIVFSVPEDARSYYDDLAKGGIINGRIEHAVLFKIVPTHVITSTKNGATIKDV